MSKTSWFVSWWNSFSQHVNVKNLKANKKIGIIKGLWHILLRKTLITICNSFIKPYFDYYDIYVQPNNKSFRTKIERIQFNAALAITGAIRGTSQIKLFKEQGLEYLRFRTYCRRQCALFIISISSRSEYLLSKIASSQAHYSTRNTDQVEFYYCRTDTF